LNNGIGSTSKTYQSIELQFYIVICLDRGTDLNRLLTSYWQLLRGRIKLSGLYERCNMSRKCLNTMIHRILVNTSLCHLNIFIVMN